MIRKLYIFIAVVMILCVDCILACDYPIYPVKVTMDVYQERILVKLKTNVAYWREVILGKECTLPATRWPQDTVKGARGYLNAHFKVLLDGHQVAGILKDYKYIEAPFLGNKGSNLVFYLEYPVRSPVRELTVHSVFFPDYYEHIHGDCGVHNHAQSIFYQEFATYIYISGREGGKYVIPLLVHDEHSHKHAHNHYEECTNDTSFYFDDVLITRGQVLARMFMAGVGHVAAVPSILMLLVLAVVLYFRKGCFPVRAVILFSGILLISFIAGALRPTLMPFQMVRIWIFAGLVIACIITRTGLRDTWKTAAFCLVLPAWGVNAAHGVYSASLYGNYPVAGHIVFFLGWHLVICIAVLAGVLLLVLDRKYLLHRSSAMAERLFVSHCRFFIIAVGILSLLNLIQVLR